MGGGTAVFDFVEGKIEVTSVETYVLAFPLINIVFSCTDDHIFTVVAQKYFVDCIALF